MARCWRPAPRSTRGQEFSTPFPRAAAMNRLRNEGLGSLRLLHGHACCSLLLGLPEGLVNPAHGCSPSGVAHIELGSPFRCRCAAKSWSSASTGHELGGCTELADGGLGSKRSR